MEENRNFSDLYGQLKLKMMNTTDIEVKESPGVQFAKAMLERKKQAIKEAQEEFKNNPEKRKALEELKKRNEERGTPVIKL